MNCLYQRLCVYACVCASGARTSVLAYVLVVFARVVDFENAIAVVLSCIARMRAVQHIENSKCRGYA